MYFYPCNCLSRMHQERSVGSPYQQTSNYHNSIIAFLLPLQIHLTHYQHTRNNNLLIITLKTISPEFLLSPEIHLFRSLVQGLILLIKIERKQKNTPQSCLVLQHDFLIDFTS